MTDPIDLPPPLPAWFPPSGQTVPQFSLPYAPPDLRFQPPKPRVWPVFIAFVLVIVVSIVISVIGLLAAAAALNGPQALSDPVKLREVLERTERIPAVLFPLALTTSLTLLAAAVIAARLSPLPMRQRLQTGPSSLSPVGYVIVIVGALAVSQLSNSIINLLGVGESGSLKLLDDVMRNLSGVNLALALFCVSLAAGVAEEIFFRGYAQSRLVKRWGPVAGILITSALFGIIHMDPVHSSFAFAFGSYLGLVAYRVGSIRPTIASHIVNNAVAVLLPALNVRVDGRGWDWGGLAVSVVVLALVIVYINRRTPQAPSPS
jgi:uncharacterized protein